MWQLVLGLLLVGLPGRRAWKSFFESLFGGLLCRARRLLTATARGGWFGSGAAGLPRWFFWHGEALEICRTNGSLVMIPLTSPRTTTSIVSPP
jgi:hypothetical protein